MPAVGRFTHAQPHFGGLTLWNSHVRVTKAAIFGKTSRAKWLIERWNI
jgi:hypothetical protein